ncbi:ribosomal protein l1p/L10e family domain-containing protein [Ditylenchus destructor]|uniref:Ribosomal protein l1p/L10e family domain-containing protein n=1 Tax=Ditylenchus destructor TaxID=166010 RepID=A0AAD4N5J6_9BILA|nr:ribosomal protein l1p/L10e family domain-containing protein [Ditylenchus destructor]
MSPKFDGTDAQHYNTRQSTNRKIAMLLSQFVAKRASPIASQLSRALFMTCRGICSAPIQTSNLRSLLQTALTPTSCSWQLEQVRGRKRFHNRPLSKVERAARRQKREEKIAMEKDMKEQKIIRSKIMQQQKKDRKAFYGGKRYSADAELKMTDPEHDVYFRNMYRTQFHSIEQALQIYREMTQPGVLNNPKALIKMRFELNMTTEKKTKTIGHSEELVALPNPFPHSEKRAILVFAPTDELKKAAVDAGAAEVLGANMVKPILKGNYNISDFDFCVAHNTMAKDIITLRGIMKAKFPTALNGALTDDLPLTLKRFIAGIKLIITVDPRNNEYGVTENNVAVLSMTDEQILENIGLKFVVFRLKSIYILRIKAICAHRKPELGPFINRAEIICEKVNYSVDITRFVPEVDEDELEKFADKIRKKKKKTQDKKTKEENEKKLMKYRVEMPNEAPHLIELM